MWTHVWYGDNKVLSIGSLIWLFIPFAYYICNYSPICLMIGVKYLHKLRLTSCFGVCVDQFKIAWGANSKFGIPGGKGLESINMCFLFSRLIIYFVFCDHCIYAREVDPNVQVVYHTCIYIWFSDIFYFSWHFVRIALWYNDFSCYCFLTSDPLVSNGPSSHYSAFTQATSMRRIGNFRS